MLKPKLPELPNVDFLRTPDGKNILIRIHLKDGVKELEMNPNRFFKQTVHVIREIKDLMR
jgi:hypothetical protein